MTELELCHLLQTKPENALPVLIDRYSGLVVSVLRAKGCGLLQKEDLEELTSDCFLCLFEQRNRINLSKGSIASLLCVIAQRKAVDFLRKQNRRPHSQPLGDDDIFTSAVQPDQTQALTDRQALLQAVRDLGHPDAEIIFRKYYLGLSHKQIGDALGLSENAVTKRLRRSLKKLKSKVEGETFNG